jgi:hypothetical protein
VRDVMLADLGALLCTFVVFAFVFLVTNRAPAALKVVVFFLYELIIVSESMTDYPGYSLRLVVAVIVYDLLLLGIVALSLKKGKRVFENKLSQVVLLFVPVVEIAVIRYWYFVP